MVVKRRREVKQGRCEGKPPAFREFTPVCNKAKTKMPAEAGIFYTIVINSVADLQGDPARETAPAPPVYGLPQLINF